MLCGLSFSLPTPVRPSHSPPPRPTVSAPNGTATTAKPHASSAPYTYPALFPPRALPPPLVHPRRIGAPGARGLNGYYSRSHIPASLVSDFMDAFVRRSIGPAVTHLLVLDLCCGQQSVRAGVSAVRGRAAWKQIRPPRPLLRYFGVDCDASVAPDLALDLTDTHLPTLVGRVAASLGWSVGPHLAVCVWFSPPCETYSRMTLGTLSSPRFGGPSRVWSDGVYLPATGPAGARARASDLLIQSLLPQLLSASF